MTGRCFFWFCVFRPELRNAEVCKDEEAWQEAEESSSELEEEEEEPRQNSEAEEEEEEEEEGEQMQDDGHTHMVSATGLVKLEL